MALFPVIPIEHRGLNFFDNFMTRMTPADDMMTRMKQAEMEIDAMRRAMFQLVPQDLNDMGKMQIKPTSPDQDVFLENGERNLRLKFDVKEFKPDEIKVKVMEDNMLQVSADHTESTNEGYKHCAYERRYLLPKGAQAESVRPTLTNDGVLVIEAPLPTLPQPDEKVLQIQPETEQRKLQ
jgi:crystallin alpha B